MRDPLLWLAGAHAAYYVITGVWPLVHMRSFLAVTGPKRDLWLVKTVGVLVGVIGAVIAVAVARAVAGAVAGGAIPLEVMLLAVGSAAALAAVDVNYVARGVIDRIYLLDAFGEVILIALWLILWRW